MQQYPYLKKAVVRISEKPRIALKDPLPFRQKLHRNSD